MTQRVKPQAQKIQMRMQTVRVAEEDAMPQEVNPEEYRCEQHDPGGGREISPGDRPHYS